MPKRKASSTTAPAKAAPAPKEKATLVDQAEADSPPKRRALTRRGSDAIIDRALTEHFSHLSPFQRVTQVVEGRTLRERIADDRASLSPKQRLSATYWRDLAKLYAAEGCPIAALAPGDDSMTVSDQLVAALAQLHHRNPAARSGEPLIAFLRHAPTVNRSEAVGLCKALIAPAGVRKKNMDSLMVEVMKCFIRCSIVSSYPDIALAMKSHFDSSMSSHYSRLKSGGVGLAVFFQCHEKEAALVLDMDDVHVVLQANGGWGDVSHQINRLTSGSLLGKTCFGFASKHVDAASFATKLHSLLAEVENKPCIDKAVIADFKAKASVAVKQLGSTTLNRRELKLQYGRYEALVQCTDASQECEYRLAALVKTLSIRGKADWQLYHGRSCCSTTGRTSRQLSPPRCSRKCRRRGRWLWR